MGLNGEEELVKTSDQIPETTVDQLTQAYLKLTDSSRDPLTTGEIETFMGTYWKADPMVRMGLEVRTDPNNQGITHEQLMAWMRKSTNKEGLMNPDEIETFRKELMSKIDTKLELLIPTEKTETIWPTHISGKKGGYLRWAVGLGEQIKSYEEQRDPRPYVTELRFENERIVFFQGSRHNVYLHQDALPGQRYVYSDSFYLEVSPTDADRKEKNEYVMLSNDGHIVFGSKGFDDKPLQTQPEQSEYFLDIIESLEAPQYDVNEEYENYAKYLRGLSTEQLMDEIFPKQK